MGILEFIGGIIFLTLSALFAIGSAILVDEKNKAKHERNKQHNKNVRKS